MNASNNKKFILLTIFNIILYGGLFYYGFLFNSVWTNWGRRLVNVCLLTIFIDFILMELLLEVLIILMIKINLSGFENQVVKFILGLKYLRNMN